jgi:hypothetical protein
MKTYQATTNIKAPAEKIWQILTDGPRYPEWDPWAIRIEGNIAAGEKVTAYSKLSPNRAFPVKVTTFEPGRKMVWSGGMPLGLFKGIREFILSPKGDGTIDFTVREEFSGPLLALMGRSLPDMTQPFQDFVNGLKTRAEGV